MAELNKLVDLIYKKTHSGIYTSGSFFPSFGGDGNSPLETIKENAVKAIALAMEQEGMVKCQNLYSLMEPNVATILKNIYEEVKKGNIKTAVRLASNNYVELNTSMLIISRHLELGESIELATIKAKAANSFNISGMFGE